MSESKSRLVAEGQSLKASNADLYFKCVRLLTYLHNMQLDHPELDWPELPDNYPEMMWRYAGV